MPVVMRPERLQRLEQRIQAGVKGQQALVCRGAPAPARKQARQGGTIADQRVQLRERIGAGKNPKAANEDLRAPRGRCITARGKMQLRQRLPRGARMRNADKWRPEKASRYRSMPGIARCTS